MTQAPTGGLRLALDLTELGARLREQRYRREHPGCTENEAREFMTRWWLDRPGAPDGDAPGRPVDLARFRD